MAPSLHRRFLSTLPARGATCFCLFLKGAQHISIHAPREGSDRTRSWRTFTPSYFYPRSPRGERRRPAGQRPGLGDFYPRSPRGERRVELPEIPRPKIFLSTLPARGATYTACYPSNTDVFLSTLPARGATISTRYKESLAEFLSTLPVRGATFCKAKFTLWESDFYPRSP